MSLPPWTVTNLRFFPKKGPSLLLCSGVTLVSNHSVAHPPPLHPRYPRSTRVESVTDPRQSSLMCLSSYTSEDVQGTLHNSQNQKKDSRHPLTTSEKLLLRSSNLKTKSLEWTRGHISDLTSTRSHLYSLSCVLRINLKLKSICYVWNNHIQGLWCTLY